MADQGVGTRLTIVDPSRLDQALPLCRLPELEPGWKDGNAPDVFIGTFAVKRGLFVKHRNRHAELTPLTGIDLWLSRWWKPSIFDGDGRCVYLRRFQVAKYKEWRLYLHHWLHDDWSLHLHNHSRGMLSIGLWGSYTEELPHHQTARWRAPWIRYFPSTHQHRVILKTKTVWTLILAFPVTGKGSGFFVNGQYINSSLYMSSPLADQQPKC